MLFILDSIEGIHIRSSVSNSEIFGRKSLLQSDRAAKITTDSTEKSDYACSICLAFPSSSSCVQAESQAILVSHAAVTNSLQYSDDFKLFLPLNVRFLLYE